MLLIQSHDCNAFPVTSWNNSFDGLEQHHAVLALSSDPQHDVLVPNHAIHDIFRGSAAPIDIRTTAAAAAVSLQPCPV